MKKSCPKCGTGMTSNIYMSNIKGKWRKCPTCNYCEQVVKLHKPKTCKHCGKEL